MMLGLSYICWFYVLQTTKIVIKSHPILGALIGWKTTIDEFSFSWILNIQYT